MSTFLIGRSGENEAAKFLEKNGYNIIKKNYHAANGEIDIIAKKGRHLSFVEVKTRKDISFGYPSDAVTFRKQQKIINTAKAFLTYYDEYDEVSFDVCEVYLKERRVNYIENAFSAE